MGAQRGSQPEKRTDPRVRKTKKALQDALISLVTERGFDAVTVQEVAKRAQVNRTTFYRHFRDKYELMRWGMEEVFSGLAWRPWPADPRDASFDYVVEHVESVLIRMADHADFCRAMFALDKGSPLVVEGQYFIEQIMLYRAKMVSVRHRQVLVPDEVALPMVIGGAIGLVSWWLRRNMPYSPREMAIYLVRLVSEGPFRCVGIDSLKEGGAGSCLEPEARGSV